MGKVLNYYDFYCGECKYYLELWDKRKDCTRGWCDRNIKRVKEEDPGCPAFEIGLEGDEDE